MTQASPATARRRTSLRVWMLSAGLAGAAVVVQVVSTRGTPGHAAAPLRTWLLLVLGFVLAEMCVVHITVRREGVSFAFAEIPWVLGLFFVSPTQLIAARVTGGALALIWHRRQTLLKLAFNTGTIITIETAISGPHSTLCSPWNCARPSESVYCAGSFR